MEGCHVNNHASRFSKKPSSFRRPSASPNPNHSLQASISPTRGSTSFGAKEAENRLAAFEAGQMKAYPADEVFQEFADL